MLLHACRWISVCLLLQCLEIQALFCHVELLPPSAQWLPQLPPLLLPKLPPLLPGSSSVCHGKGLLPPRPPSSITIASESQWTGCVLRTLGGVHALVSKENWDKMKSCSDELDSLIKSTPNAIPVKSLQRIRGFLNCVTQTHRGMIPHLNGLHLTIDGWRPNRNAEGWRSAHSCPCQGLPSSRCAVSERSVLLC